MADKCFCHLNGYAVKDATARKEIETLKEAVAGVDDIKEAIRNNTVEGEHSLACGHGNYVPGNDCFVAGHENGVTEESNIVGGRLNSVSGKHNSVAGENHKISGDWNCISGGDNECSGNANIVGGSANRVQGKQHLVAGYDNRFDQTAIRGCFVSGEHNSMKKSYAMAHGYENTVGGNYGVAIGYKSQACADSSIAMGSETVAVGVNSLALGKNTRASGKNSVAMGNGVKATGELAFAYGNVDANLYPDGNTTINGTKYTVGANGVASVVIGGSNTAQGASAISLGAHCASIGARTFSAGQRSYAIQDDSVAIGKYCRTGKTMQCVVGKYNATSSDAVFVVGDGTSDTARSNAMELISENGVVTLKIGDASITDVHLRAILESTASIPGTITALNNQITTLQNTVTQLEKDNTQLKTDVTNHTFEINTLKNKVATLETDVDKLETTVATQNTRIGVLETKVTSLTTEVTALKERANGHDSNLSNHERRIKALEEDSEGGTDTTYPYFEYSYFVNNSGDTVTVGSESIADGQSATIAVATVHSATSTTPIYLDVTVGFYGTNVVNSAGTTFYTFGSEEMKPELYFKSGETFIFADHNTPGGDSGNDNPSISYPYYEYATFINNSEDPWTIGGKSIASIGGQETIAVATVHSATSTTPIYLDIEAGFTGSDIVDSSGTVKYTLVSEEVRRECYFAPGETYTITG